mmetsp:Transcript_36076/g.92994  ORF Transcript_36076/g.92994 Transcript_36076/m.92994 type:complete len:118 (+) Transcript_36076:1331-1684(+)
MTANLMLVEDKALLHILLLIRYTPLTGTAAGSPAARRGQTCVTGAATRESMLLLLAQPGDDARESSSTAVAFTLVPANCLYALCHYCREILAVTGPRQSLGRLQPDTPTLGILLPMV